MTVMRKVTLNDSCDLQE